MDFLQPSCNGHLIRRVREWNLNFQETISFHFAPVSCSGTHSYGLSSKVWSPGCTNPGRVCTLRAQLKDGEVIGNNGICQVLRYEPDCTLRMSILEKMRSPGITRA